MSFFEELFKGASGDDEAYGIGGFLGGFMRGFVDSTRDDD
jgi:hypothetical protein